MAFFKQTELEMTHRFDPVKCRHYLNGQTSVLHCHHYATLYSQLADDCGMLDGKKLLAETAEDVFGDVLKKYFKERCIETITDRLDIAVQYYSAVGLGKMRVVFAGTESAEIELEHSHVDEGWIKKWGKREAPVNFMTAGYVAGMLSAVFELPPRAFDVHETESLVSGADVSRFTAVRK